MKKSQMFRKDYDYGFLDERTVGIVRVKQENPVMTVVAFVAIVALLGLVVAII